MGRRGFTKIKYNNMLIFGFGQPIGKVREWHNRRMKKEFNIPHNFMQMSVWEEMTEEQFNILVTLLDADLIESFIIVACYYNMAITKERIRKRRSSEENKERCRRYHEKNRDKIRKRQREYYQKNKEAMRRRGREYYRKNKDKILKDKKEYYHKNADKFKKRTDEYWLKNKDEINKKRREDYHKNKEK